MLEICGKKLESGTKLQCWLGPEGYPMPVTLIAGARPGKTLVVTAQIHGGEYAGTPAVIRLAKVTDPAELSGNLVLFHLVNVSGFYSGNNAYVAEDHGNLNGCYPGSPDGTVSLRIADFFVKNIMPCADALVDLHGGGLNEKLSPCLFYPGKDEKTMERSLRMAEATDIPNFVISRSATGEMGYAGNVLNIPALLLERGYGGMCLEEWVDDYVMDLKRIMASLGICSCETGSVCEKRNYVNAVYLEAEEDGIWYPAVVLNQKVKKGQFLGHVEDFFGKRLNEYYAEGDGEVLYFRFAKNAVKGHNLVTYGLND